MLRTRLLALVVFCPLWLGGATASAPDDVEDFLDSAACPQVFGTDTARETNEKERGQSLFAFAAGDKGWEIVHTVPKWRRPTPLRLGDIVVDGLAEVQPDEDGGHEDALVVRLSGALAKQCESGPYLVHVDDAMGQRARVLGLSEEAALVELDGRLRAMPFEGEKIPPRVRMVWRSAYDITLSAPAAAPKKATKARAKAKKAKRKRRKKR